MATIKSYTDIENKTNDELIGFGDIVSPSYEQWADIEGFNGKYKISTLGRVLSTNYARKGIPVMLKIRTNNEGYCVVPLRKEGSQNSKNYLVHRLVAQAFVPNPDNMPIVNHLDEFDIDVLKNARLWDITKDAKDGDVIYSRHNTESFEWIGIFKSLDIENKRAFFYGFWHIMSKSFRVCGNEAYVLYDDFSPATKEQRNQLEKAMTDAGYTFDFEKKKLNKIEPKPVEWSEKDERIYSSIMYSFAHNYPLTIQQQEFVKSLKDKVQPQNTWKPSDEQMEALDGICSYIRNQADWEISQDTIHQLYSLSEQLKKLKA